MALGPCTAAPDYSVGPTMVMLGYRRPMNGCNATISHGSLAISSSSLTPTTSLSSPSLSPSPSSLSSPSPSPLSSPSPSPMSMPILSSSNYSTGVGHVVEGSPIPYLLAGLAAMLGLIAVSLFILACSYWKLVGSGGANAHEQDHHHHHLAQPNDHRSSQTANGSHNENSSSHCSKGLLSPDAYSPQDSSKLAVIMAGHNFPTFLAQPVDIVESTSDVKPC